MPELPEVFEIPRPKSGSRGWLALGASAVVHTLLILLILFGIPVGNPSTSVSTGAPPATTPIPLAAYKPTTRRTPPKQAEQTPNPPPAPPPPPDREVALGPDSKKPDAPPKEAAAPTPPAGMPDPVRAPATPPLSTSSNATTPPAADHAPAKAQRMMTASDYAKNFTNLLRSQAAASAPVTIDSASGGSSPPADAASAAGNMGRAGMNSHDPRHWETSFDDETAGRCVSIPDLGKNPDGTPVLGSVVGTVFDTDGKTPMAGAHLQIMGTVFNTFTDSKGDYRLEFDPNLLQKCRSQVVMVVAPGYKTQMLQLMIGHRIRSDDVVLKHH